METETRHLYEFGDFCLDAAERLLLRRGQAVPLTPKAFETLCYLVSRSGHIVEKEELLSAVWPDTFVEEATLAQNIFTLRRALGQGRETLQYIETVPKRGYRFIAGVRELRDEGAMLVVEQHTRTHIIAEEALENSSDTNSQDDFTSAATHPETYNHAVAHAAELSAAPEAAPAKTIWQQLKRHQTATVLGLLMPVLVLAILAYRYSQSAKPEAAVTNPPAPFQKMRFAKLTTNGKAVRAALSPDGKYLAHVRLDNGLQSLWIRQVAANNNVQIVAPAAVRYRGITFSPDGNHVYYVTYDKPTNPALAMLYQVPTLGGTPRKLLDDVDSPITFSPDGKRYAFVRGYPAERETALIIVNSDGTGERKLATRQRPSYFSFEGPSWSPDGKWIACGAGGIDKAESYMNVVALKVDDGSERELSPQRWNWVGQLAWMGDGSGLLTIAWHLDDSVFADQIWHLSTATGAARRVTNDLDGYRDISVAADSGALVTVQTARLSRIWIAPRGESEHATQITSGFGDNYSEMFGMAWTPDGRILYGSHADGNPDIWMMNADGSNQKQLTVDPRADYSPVATSDGRYIVFVSNRANGLHLWRMNMDGSNLLQLTSGAGEEAPSLSPDGRWVIYSAFSGITPTLWKVPIDGGEPTLLTSQPSQRPLVSPDGKLIACLYQGKVAILPFAGGEALKTFEAIPSIYPQIIRWMSDSRALAYLDTQGGVANIWSQPVDGSAPKQVTNFKDDSIFRFAWSPDGSTLACERGTEINDIILVSDFK